MKKLELDDLVRDAKKDAPDLDWKSVDEKLFARLEKEPTPRTAARDEDEGRSGRVVWIGAALSLAAAAAALVFVHPAQESTDTRAETAQSPAMESAHGALALGDRIDVKEDVAYFDSPGKVRWSAPRGSVLRVEHAGSPLVLSLEQGAAEAQVTPVPSGEAFAIDVTASSGAIVRVAVHGTHLRVAREGDKVTVDLTEGVVSIGAPPRRGSTIGTLVTAPAHVELDARDLAAIRVDHDPAAVRPAESVTPPETETQTALLTPAPVLHDATETAAHEALHPALSFAQPKSHAGNPATTAPQPQWLTTPDEVAAAIAECPRGTGEFTATLTFEVRDDGTVSHGRFTVPGSARMSALFPEARDCVDDILYKRTKLATPGAVTVPVHIASR